MSECKFEQVPTKEIPLTQGKVAIVDAEDYGRVSAIKWFAHYSPPGLWYAHSTVTKKTATTSTLLMHRVILAAPDGTLVDHKDGNGLNNTRSNIRLAPDNGNHHNCRLRSDNTSGFKGVAFCKNAGKWRAQIMHRRIATSLGLFASPVEAARAYDAAAKDKFGEFAWLNFPK